MVNYDAFLVNCELVVASQWRAKKIVILLILYFGNTEFLDYFSSLLDIN